LHTFAGMSTAELKKELEVIVKDLGKQWADEVDGKDRTTPMDYIRTSIIEGELNMAMRILSMLP